MKNNKIVLSIVVSSLLFSQSYALPSGGKFTHGTSGSINVNGNTMNITGNKANSVIQWGGGFNIAKGETVNFGQGKTNQNYLNIAYGTKSSTIDGLLNATGNNVYLINPNGVVIGKSGTINANKFGVSTSSMSNTEMQNFANSTNPIFSPVFKPNNKGNVVNMGNINAKDVLIIGNEVGNIGTNGVGNFNLQDNGKVQFVGDKVKVNVGSIKNAKDLIVSAQTTATLGQSTTDVYKNNTNNLDDKFKVENYSGFSKYLQKSDIDKKTTIANAEDWAYFAKGINEGKTGIQSVDTFDLISDIDFGANCDSNGKCTGQNYANFNVAGNSELQGVNMIVGFDYYSNPFSANFNGNGHTLSNINIDTTMINYSLNVGLFGKAIGTNKTIKNLIIDYKGGSIKTHHSSSVGGFIGQASNGYFLDTISLNNIGSIHTNGSHTTGGFAGTIDNASNITVNNIGSINCEKCWSTGGFVGGYNYKADFAFTNISINNIGSIKSTENINRVIGGFVGGNPDAIDYPNGRFENISINNIGIIGDDTSGFSYAGGFMGLYNGNISFKNISINNIESINGDNSGGFAGYGLLGVYNFENISINNIKNIKGTRLAAGFMTYAEATVGSFKNIILNNIKNISATDSNSEAAGFITWFDTENSLENVYIFFNPDATITANTVSLFSNSKANNYTNVHIYHKEGTLSNATADKDYWNKVDNFTDLGQDNKINIHTYDDGSKDKAYQAFLKKTGDITITPPETPKINSDFTIEQTNNKISQDDIDKDVIDSILADTDVDSWIDIKDPTKIQLSKGDINSINQSFDFMEALGDNFINNYLQNKGATEIKNILQTKTNIKALIGNVNNLVNNYNDFQNTKEDLNKAINAYNAYVALINQGAASSKDAAFTSLKNKVNELYAKAQGYLDTYKFDDTLKSYKTQALSQSNNHFSIKGEFDTELASLDSVLNKPNNEGGDTSNPEANAPLPFSEALLTQMDENIVKQDEDDKEPTVDEVSTQLSGNACIVSDNFKVGNPCSR